MWDCRASKDIDYPFQEGKVKEFGGTEKNLSKLKKQLLHNFLTPMLALLAWTKKMPNTTPTPTPNAWLNRRKLGQKKFLSFLGSHVGVFLRFLKDYSCPHGIWKAPDCDVQ